MLPALSLLLLAVLAVTQPHLAAGLSYSVCDDVGEEFITEGPRLEGQWPYYSLLYTCASSLEAQCCLLFCQVNSTFDTSSPLQVFWHLESGRLRGGCLRVQWL